MTLSKAPMCLPRERRQVQNIQEAYNDELKIKPTAENNVIHLSLCGGMGADVYVMRQVGAKFMRTILVKKDEIKRIVCDNLNPPGEMSDGGIDYAWHTDVHDITWTSGSWVQAQLGGFASQLRAMTLCYPGFCQASMVKS